MISISNEARSLFEEIVVEDHEDDWTSVLDRCNGNELLAKEVVSLLRAYDGADSLLDLSFQSDPSGQFAVSGELENFRLLKLIGVGGFGEVYEAEQVAPLRRRVAIKVVRSGMNSSDVLSRFENERQTLAMLNHPNIARILDVGTCNHGRPFFVMDLVSGSDVATFCDENEVCLTERVNIFVDICHAVQHAHLKGVIHRDLKPSNVLIENSNGNYVPKVIDFGISKLIGSQTEARTYMTRESAIIGTPLFMSPEQARRSKDVDTRSDVYSLGGILYKLVTGDTPINSEMSKESDFIDLLEMVRNREPVRPSDLLASSENVETIANLRATTSKHLAQQVRGDLDWILMKALDKEPNRRYSSVADFADDLLRWIEGDAVNARPPSFVYKAQKVFRKHRVLVSSLTVVFLVLVAATLFSLQMARIATINKNSAEQTNFAAYELIIQPDRRGAGQDVRLLDCYETVIEQRLANPNVFPELDLQIFAGIGSQYFECDMFQESLLPFKQAIQISEQLGVNSQPLGARLAISYAQTGNLTAAKSLAEEIIQADQNVSVSPSPAEFSEPRSSSIFYATLALARVYQNEGDYELAKKTARKAFVAAQNQSKRFLELIRARKELALISINSDPDYSKKLAEINLEQIEEKLGSESYDALSARHTLAKCLFASGNTSAAIEIFEQILPDLKQSLTQNNPKIVSTLLYMAWANRHSGKASEVEQQFNEADALYHSLKHPSHALTRLFQSVRASLLRAKNHLGEAEQIQKLIVKESAQHFGPRSRKTILDSFNLALGYEQSEKFGLAAKIFGECVAWLNEFPNYKPLHEIDWNTHWIQCLNKANDFDTAKRQGRAFLSVLEQEILAGQTQQRGLDEQIAQMKQENLPDSAVELANLETIRNEIRNRIVECKKAKVVTLLNAARSYMATHDGDSALQLLNEAIELDIYNPEYKISSAVEACMEFGYLEEAGKILTAGLASHNNNPRLKWYLSKVQLKEIEDLESLDRDQGLKEVKRDLLKTFEDFRTLAANDAKNKQPTRRDLILRQIRRGHVADVAELLTEVSDKLGEVDQKLKWERVLSRLRPKKTQSK